MKNTRELLAEYVTLLNKHGVQSQQEVDFVNDHLNNQEFVSVASLSRKLKEYLAGDVLSWLDGPLQHMEQRVAALEQRAETAELVAKLIEADPHGFSTRPCQTCRAVSALLRRPFGCEVKAGRKVE